MNKGGKVHFASLEPQNHLYKGKIIPRIDIVKDDSGSYVYVDEKTGWKEAER